MKSCRIAVVFIFLLNNIVYSQFYTRIGYSNTTLNNSGIINCNGLYGDIGGRIRMNRIHNILTAGAEILFVNPFDAYVKEDNNYGIVTLENFQRSYWVSLKFRTEYNLIEKEKFDFYLGFDYTHSINGNILFSVIGGGILATFYYKLNKKTFLWITPEVSYNSMLKQNNWVNYNGLMYQIRLGIGWRNKKY